MHAQQDLVARAGAIHERVITLDTHNDIDPANFTPRVQLHHAPDDAGEPAEDDGGRARRVVHDRLRRAVNPPQVADAFQPAGYDRAYKAAIAKFDAVHRLTEQIAPDEIELALTRRRRARIAKSGKKVAVIGVENGYPIGTDLNRVKEFYDRGGRYMSLAHNGHSQLADSNTGEADNEWKWNGLSPLGKQVIAGDEQVGHHGRRLAPVEGVDDAGDRPVEGAGHRVALGGRALANISRNMDDEKLLAMKKNGGVVQMVAFASYVKADPPERGPAIDGAARRSSACRRTRGRGGGRAAAAAAGAPQRRRRCPVGDAAHRPAPAAAGAAAAAAPRRRDAVAPIGAPSSTRRLAEIDASGRPPAARPSRTSSITSTTP